MKNTVNKANLNVRIDKDIKERACEVLASMGLDQTTAIDMFLRQVIVINGLPFQPTAREKYGEELLEIIKRKNIPNVELEVNEQGHIIIDDNIKENYPDIYDWAVNG